MTNHLTVMNEAIGSEAAGKVKAALEAAGYVIYKGDPMTERDGLKWKIAQLEAELAGRLTVEEARRAFGQT